MTLEQGQSNRGVRPFLARLQEMEERTRKMCTGIETFLDQVADHCQPARKLHDVTINAMQSAETFNVTIMQPSIDSKPPAPAPHDRRIVFGARAVHIKALFVFLAYRLSLVREMSSATLDLSSESPLPDVQLANDFFATCDSFIAECGIEKLPKLDIEARLFYGRAVRLYNSSTLGKEDGETRGSEYVNAARFFFEGAIELCRQPFYNVDKLRTAAEEVQRVLGKEWYEPVSAQELEAVKSAMVSGSYGLATYSGHWYNCRNGHPISLFSFFCGYELEAGINRAT